MVSTTAAAVPHAYQGTDKLIFGIVLAVTTFGLFAQTTLNVAPTMREERRISENLINIAVSITALFSGIFIVVAGSLADRLGRVKLTSGCHSEHHSCRGKASSEDGSAKADVDNVAVRFAAAIALLFNVLMVIIAIIAIIMTVPKQDRLSSRA